MNTKEKVFLGYGHLKSIIFGLKRPFFVSWQVTERCNLRCTYCHSSGNRVNEIGALRSLEIIESLYRMGTRVVRFTGGEPLLREDLPALVSCCRKFGIFTGIASNGILFPDMVNELKSLSAVSFSLDGPEDIHDSLRGTGTHKLVIKAIEAAKTRNIYTTVSVTLSKFNLDSVGYILDLAKKFRIKAFFQPATKRAVCSDGTESFSPDANQFKKAMEALISQKSKNRFIGNSRMALKHMSCWPEKKAINCVAGKIICRINCDGQLYPCPRFRMASRELNVLKKDIRECFNGLAQPYCQECWCSLFVELNLLSRLTCGTIVNALLS